MATGKSYLINALKDIASSFTIKINILDVDTIRRELLQHSINAEDILFRKHLIDLLRLTTYGENYALNGKDLQREIFNDKEKYLLYTKEIGEKIRLKLLQKIETTSGILIIERALLVEDNFYEIPFDLVYYLICNQETIQSRLKGGGFTTPELAERLKNFYNIDKIIHILEEKYKNSYRILNTKKFPNKNLYKEIFNEIALKND
ncbi:MAG: dephospho-CoA kinase [Candidatus Peribacteria bacterium]|nr:dephospho-CoA kinase [Candidatus Peribacteria bacterium]